VEIRTCECGKIAGDQGRSGEIRAGESLAWMVTDVPVRILPLALAFLAYAALSGRGVAGTGLLPADPPLELARVLRFGTAFFLGAMVFPWRVWGLRSYPSTGDMLVKSAFFLFLHAPAEELFFRGFLQSFLMGLSGSASFGLLAASAVFGFYHRLFGHPWRRVPLYFAFGLLFGLIYLDGKLSLAGLGIAHGMGDMGLYSLGPYLLALRRRSCDCVRS